MMQASTRTRQAQGLIQSLSTLQSHLEKTPGITGESLQRYIRRNSDLATKDCVQ